MNEMMRYNITIRTGEDYIIDFAYIDDDDVAYDMTGWKVESTLREFAESNDGIDFVGKTDVDGIHLFLSSKTTKEIGYSNGEYDVFITDPDNNKRVKLIVGTAHIVAESTRQ